MLFKLATDKIAAAKLLGARLEEGAGHEARRDHARTYVVFGARGRLGGADRRSGRCAAMLQLAAAVQKAPSLRL